MPNFPPPEQPCYGYIAYGPSAFAAPTNIANVRFPHTGKPKLSIEPIYADDGVTLMYYEHTLTLQVVIYENVLLHSPSVETEVARIKGILATPSQQLIVSMTGLGGYIFVNAGTPDLKGGPFPQEVTVEPIASNNAIYVSWKVVFRISNCLVPLNKNVVQFNSELDFDVDDDGDLNFTLRVTYQQRDPIVGVGQLSALVNALIRFNGNNIFHGMRRRKRVSFSRDRRIVKLEVQFKDIKSDNALYPFTRDIECTDELSSSLFPNGANPGGFQLWERKLSATITLPQRVHKSYAYLVYLYIITERFKGLNVLNGTAALALQADAPPDQKADLLRRNWYLLTDVNISNPIYTRTMKFDFKYLMCQSLEDVVTKSNILARVNTSYDINNPNNPLSPSEQWQRWDNTQDKALNGFYRYETNIIEPIDLCLNQNISSLSAARVVVYSTSVEQSDQPQTTPKGSAKPPPESSYHQYQNAYELLEENNNIQVNYLEPLSNALYYASNPAATALRSITNVSLHDHIDDIASGNTKNQVIPRGIGTYYLRQKGYAVRIGYRIPFPSIKTVNNQIVRRVGQGRYSQQIIARSSDVPIYLAMWDVTYAVPNNIFTPDIFNGIVGSGDPGYYS